MSDHRDDASLSSPLPVTGHRRRAVKVGGIVAAFGLGALGSVMAQQINLPLPFLLGPLICCGIASIAGAPLLPLPWGREVGQIVVGLAIGLRFTPEVLHATFHLLPAMVLCTLGVILVTSMAAALMRRLSGVDRKTAFFATAAGGLAEMAVVARDRGGDAEAVSVVHAVRVVGVVLAVPILVTLLGEDGGLAPALRPTEGELLDLVTVMAVAVAAAFLLRPLRLPNMWLLSSVAIGIIVAADDLVTIAMPRYLLIVAQILIGIWLGCRFSRKLLLRLPRVTFAAVVTTVLLLVLAAAGALLLSRTTGLPFSTSLLALAPAGVTEMVLTATVMHLDAATVTAFHVMRIVVIATTVVMTFRMFDGVSRWFDGSRL
ncbi:MAG: AbrB family transcriptional regulator [Dongiaceae bacterium]